jgi:hypothetical protein
MRRLGMLVVLIMYCGMASAQVGFGGSITERLYFGGGGSFGAGTNYYNNRYTYYSIFPIIGYRVTPQFSAGTGFNLQHYGYPDLGPSYSYTQYGVSPFLRYNFNQLFFQTEYDAINSATFDNTTGYPETSRKIYSRLLFGLGFSQPFRENGRGAINAMVMYDVLYRQPSVFNSPVVARVFVTF